MFKNILITIFFTMAMAIVPSLQAATAIQYGLIAVGGSPVTGTTSAIVNGAPVTVIWSVSLGLGTTYSYGYQITFPSVNQVPVGDFIIETSASAALNQFSFINITVNGGPATYSGTPGSIFGLDLAVKPATPTDIGNVLQLGFATTYAPAYGDFLLTTGSTTAYNTNFGTSPTATTTNFSGWIAAPLVPAPEPSLYLCMSIPLIFTALYKAKAFKLSRA